MLRKLFHLKNRKYNGFLGFKRSRGVNLQKLDTDDIPKLLEPENTLFNAKILRVIDGDTVEIAWLHGGKVPTRILLRIGGIDTPELKPKNKSKLKNKLERQAAVYVTEIIENELNTPDIQVEFFKWDKYGRRIVGDIRINHDYYLSGFILANEYGYEYDGKKKKPFTNPFLKAIINNADQA